MELGLSRLIEDFARFEGRGSDIHVSVGNPVFYRVDGAMILAPSFSSPLSALETQDLKNDLFRKLSNQERKFHQTKLEKLGHTGFSVSFNGLRFRVNISRLGEGFHVVFRRLRDKPPMLDELGFDDETVKALRWVIKQDAGLFLVVGATGSGKSTTLAAMVNEILWSQPKHVITLEDPIEYLFETRKSVVVQKELGRDFPRFAEGLHSALREDPDVILVGEIRDPESLDLALKAAETGHLVLSTLHTRDTVSTINRLAAMFDGGLLVRDRLAQTFVGAIAQVLFLDPQNKRRPCWEILIANGAVKNMIRENKDAQIASVLNATPMSRSFKKTAEKLMSLGLLSKEAVERLLPPETLAEIAQKSEEKKEHPGEKKARAFLKSVI